MLSLKLPITPILKSLPPGFQRILNHTMHVIKIPGLKPKGYDIALIHGIAATASTWLPLMRHLLPVARNVIVMDMPAHGLSPAPIPPYTCQDAYGFVCECLLRNLDPNHDNLIIGNSLGGAFAFKFTEDHSELVQKLVLISPAGAPFSQNASDIIDMFRPQTLEQAAQNVQRVFAFPTRKAYLLAPAFRYTVSQPGFISLIDSISEYDENPDSPIRNLLFSPDDLANFKTSTLLIWGDRDKVLPMSMRDFFDAHLPDSTTRLFPSNFGHCPQFEQPKELACHISEWLESSL